LKERRKGREGEKEDVSCYWMIHREGNCLLKHPTEKRQKGREDKKEDVSCYWKTHTEEIVF